MSRGNGRLAKRLIGGIYSKAADKLYEPVVVKTAFPLLGGALNSHVLDQGRRAVDVAAGRPILDMPVGTAYFTSAIARGHPGIVVGADIAEGMVREAAETARGNRLDNLMVVRADAHALPFASSTFAAVMCTNGLQVIPGLQPTIDELARVLAPGGSLFVSTVSLPLGAALGRRANARLPTVLAGRQRVLGAIADAGLAITHVHKSRLALLAEAVKRPA